MASNILSCILHTRPNDGAKVADRLRGLPGVELHGGADLGKLVVTIEDTQDAQASDLLADMNHVPGVINTVLIYHYGGDDIEPAPRTTPAHT